MKRLPGLQMHFSAAALRGHSRFVWVDGEGAGGDVLPCRPVACSFGMFAFCFCSPTCSVRGRRGLPPWELRGGAVPEGVPGGVPGVGEEGLFGS